MRPATPHGAPSVVLQGAPQVNVIEAEKCCVHQHLRR